MCINLISKYMNLGFWGDLKLPIMALAPMEEVTDTAFRRIVAFCGRPSVMFTEFTSTEGINSVGRKKVAHRLNYTEGERPMVAQIWGLTPENYFKSAQFINEMGFDGIDINMGCPVKNVVKMGACSALIKNPTLAKEIVLATKEGARDIPVSIKTRIGFKEIQTEEWIGFLLKECQPAALTIHGRTVKEESKAPNHWDEIGKAVKLRDEIYNSEKLKTKSEKSTNKTLILGNGDIQTLDEAYLKVEEYKLDGIMIGRGIFKNPWFFNPNINIENITISQRLEVLKMHLELYKSDLIGHKNYNELKRFFKIYINGFAGSAEFRAKLMETHGVEEAFVIIAQHFHSSSALI